MNSYAFSWAGALLITVAGFLLLRRRIPARARRHRLALLGAVLLPAGCGLIAPAHYAVNRPALEVASVVVLVLGLVLIVAGAREAREN